MGKSNASPGPGAHEPDYRVQKNTAPKFGFGSESRNGSLDTKKLTPGPGNYSLDSLIGTGP